MPAYHVIRTGHGERPTDRFDFADRLVCTAGQTGQAEPMTIKESITTVASVPQRSLFRYPGGKTWLVPEIRAWLTATRPRMLIEPFAGGGIVSLTAVAEGLVEGAILVERDRQVAAVWQTVLSKPEWLIRRILSCRLTKASVVRLLGQSPKSVRELGFQTLVRNRVQRGGILAKGAGLIKEGENGKGVLSRWYPQTLVSRIRAIQDYRDKLTFIHSDAFTVIPDYLNDPDAAWFVDPPYTAGGKCAGRRLYTHNTVDHRRLFALMAQAAGPVLMTYDEADEVKRLSADFGLAIHKIPMKNTHHTKLYELIITKPATATGHHHAERDEKIDRVPAAGVPSCL